MFLIRLANRINYSIPKQLLGVAPPPIEVNENKGLAEKSFFIV